MNEQQPIEEPNDIESDFWRLSFEIQLQLGRSQDEAKAHADNYVARLKAADIAANGRDVILMSDVNQPTGFMCKIDFDFELGHAFDGNKIYPSIDALRRDHPCADDCGIVEVSISLVRVVCEGTGL